MIHDATHGVRVNHRIHCRDKIRAPGAREKKLAQEPGGFFSGGRYLKGSQAIQAPELLVDPYFCCGACWSSCYTHDLESLGLGRWERPFLTPGLPQSRANQAMKLAVMLRVLMSWLAHNLKSKGRYNAPMLGWREMSSVSTRMLKRRTGEPG